MLARQKIAISWFLRASVHRLWLMAVFMETKWLNHSYLLFTSSIHPCLSLAEGNPKSTMAYGFHQNTIYRVATTNTIATHVNYPFFIMLTTVVCMQVLVKYFLKGAHNCDAATLLIFMLCFCCGPSVIWCLNTFLTGSWKEDYPQEGSVS